MQQFSLFILIFIFVTMQSSFVYSAEKNVRCSIYKEISEFLNTLSNEELSVLIKEAPSIHSGTGGSSFKLKLKEIPIFVKLVPLNDIEGKEENILSTKNLFNLPIYYQYGVGSAGFSVWRELSAHLMTTQWVVDNESLNFPLMYHWRILNNFHQKKPLNEEELREYIIYWGDAKTIEERVRANYNASVQLALFIEYVPETLDSWLSKKLTEGDDAIDGAIKIVERDLKEITTFMHEKNMIHFDPHFKNILTDGEHLYFSDFGLATSLQFTLSEEEQNFFRVHRNYDRYYVVGALTEWIIANFYSQDNFERVVQDYAEQEETSLLPSKMLTPQMSFIIKCYASITFKMSTFFDSLINTSKQTPFPENKLNEYWNFDTYPK